ncbi:MAG: DNA alkylation repair protein [Propionibacteriaceae bacterium]
MPTETAPAELAAIVRAEIAEIADPEKATGMQAYMKSELPFRGVTSKPLAALCRTLFNQHLLADEQAWRTAILQLWDEAEFREERYAATTLAGHRHYLEYQQPRTLELYRHLITTGAWWDHVDVIAAHLVRDILVAHRAEVTPIMRAWATDDDLWIRRTAIMCQLNLKGDLDQGLLTDCVDANLDGSTRTTGAESTFGREFFIRKAIGWALRDHFRSEPGWVVDFVDERGTRLSGLSRREALKHADRM